MLHGWKARIHHLTRNRVFLIRTAAMILVAGFASGCLVQWLRVGTRPVDTNIHEDSMIARSLRESWRKVESAAKPVPRDLLDWIERFFSAQEDLKEELGTPDVDLQAYLDSGRLFAFDVRAMVEKHAKLGTERQLFGDFVVVLVAPGADKGRAAAERIKQVATREPPVPFANEMLAHILLARDLDDEAFTAFVREGGFDDARPARERALRIAIGKRDAELLSELMSRPQWREVVTPWMRSRIGGITGDVWMQLQGIVGHQIMGVRWAMLLITLFATGLWYVILALRSGHGQWLWSRPLLPVVAGVCSVWPTLILLAYQEYHLGFTEDAPFPQDLWYYLAGVGLREELSKLALFTIFLPYLLWRRSEDQALLAGAFVGLGFALEENVQYYGAGGGIAWTRFLTANFMHLSMTAISGHALYKMLRARFGHAEKFVGTFLAVVAAHGLYDFAGSTSLEIGQVMGINILSIIILALLANHFFDLLSATSRPGTGVVSGAAVFLLGSALLIAVMFVMAGIETDTISGIAAVGEECAGVAPVMFVFWRKFEVR